MKQIFLDEIEQKIKRNFNKSAKTYDTYATIQNKIGHQLLSMIDPYLNQVSHLIDLGCGTGLLTLALAKRCTYQRFYAIDIADRLLFNARKRLSTFKITVEEQNFNYFHYENCLFDCVFSNMALQWSTNIKKTFTHINQNMRLNGFFLFSLPLKNTFQELNADAKNHFFDLSEISNLLQQSGFVLLSENQEKLLLNFNSVREALHSIKAVGANYHHPSNSSLRGKSYLSTLNNHFPIHQRFSLTYEIGYFLIRKSSHVI